MFTQAILAITFSHLALLFVLTRRFTRPTFNGKLAGLMLIDRDRLYRLLRGIP
jgi:hypothetical protein